MIYPLTATKNLQMRAYFCRADEVFAEIYLSCSRYVAQQNAVAISLPFEISRA